MTTWHVTFGGDVTDAGPYRIVRVRVVANARDALTTPVNVWASEFDLGVPWTPELASELARAAEPHLREALMTGALVPGQTQMFDVRLSPAETTRCVERHGSGQLLQSGDPIFTVSSP